MIQLKQLLTELGKNDGLSVDARAALAISKFSRDDIKYIAYKTTVPEYAQDFLEIYDSIVKDITNYFKSNFALKFKPVSKEIDEIYRLLDKGLKSRDAKCKELALKLYKKL